MLPEETRSVLKRAGELLRDLHEDKHISTEEYSLLNQIRTMLPQAFEIPSAAGAAALSSSKT